MTDNVEDLTVNYEEDGRQVVEELDKAILSKGSWTTILFKYREYDRRSEGMGPTKFTLRRYQKRSGAYRQQAKFNISSVAQARGIADQLVAWLSAEAAE